MADKAFQYSETLDMDIYNWKLLADHILQEDVNLLPFFIIEVDGSKVFGRKCSFECFSFNVYATNI